ncbi:hypothetical protein [Oceaniglobus trochenteri]|uniref:hypothetical protein n=1 Tax=Oceaniglobus trochenteri TaxID=2763260 RepID=UPI001CFFA68A|nr:hypothetical protein [Oceaniglobus trochenteri]
MHAATMTSERLQRLRRVLADGKPHSTRDIARRSHVLAISACVAELRANGAEIVCERLRVGDRWVFFYTMLKGPASE